MPTDTRLVLEHFIVDLFSFGYKCQTFTYRASELVLQLYSLKGVNACVEVKRIYSRAKNSHIHHFEIHEEPNSRKIKFYCLFSQDFLTRVRWSWHSKVVSYDYVSLCFSLNLSALEISHTIVEQNQFGYVVALDNLSELSIFNTYVCRMIDELVVVLVKLRRMRKLNIGMCRGKVNFYYIGVVEKEMAMLLDKLPDLTWLEICGTNLTTVNCMRVAYSMRHPNFSKATASFNKIKSSKEDARLTYQETFCTIATEPSSSEITWLQGQKELDYLGILNCPEDSSKSRNFPGVKDVAGSVTLEQVMVALKSYSYSTTMTHSAISVFERFRKRATADHYKLVIEAMLSSVEMIIHCLSLKNSLDQLESDTIDFWTPSLPNTPCKKCTFNKAYPRYEKLFKEFNSIVHSSCLFPH